MDENKTVPIPVQEEGAEKNIESRFTADTPDEAKLFFLKAKERLLNVNRWHAVCGALSANFQLTDNSGNPVDGEAKNGHHFKIDIPGPGSTSGEGYDWVQVEEVQQTKDPAADAEFVLIRVRPTSNPQRPDENVAHFFSDKSTSNFVVKREKNILMAAVYGRNETPNTETENLIDKARNAIVGSTAVAGASNVQWKSLTDGLLSKLN